MLRYQTEIGVEIIDPRRLFGKSEKFSYGRLLQIRLRRTDHLSHTDFPQLHSACDFGACRRLMPILLREVREYSPIFGLMGRPEISQEEPSPHMSCTMRRLTESLAVRWIRNS